MLAYPSDAVWCLFETFDDGGEEVVGNLHEHVDSWCDDVLYRLVLGGLLSGDSLGQVWGEGSLNLQLGNHLLVHLERVNLQVEILELDERVDTVLQDHIEVALTRSSPCICSHHSRYGRVGAQQRAVVWCVIELVSEHRLGGVSGLHVRNWSGFVPGT